MSFPRYPRYKDSGVEWLGEVPEHWEVRPVGSLAEVVNGYPFDSRLFDSGDAGFPLVRIRDLGQVHTEAKYLGAFIERASITSDEVLIGMDGDFNVGRWLGTGLALLNQRMCCVRAKTPLQTRFLEYALPTPLRLINDITYSTTVKHLASSQVEKTRVAQPPSEVEVQQVVFFLDEEVAKIDALIAEQQRLIELLKEKRQAVISHAVTRGLNPDAPMKPSGVEWLGDVPAHWTRCLLKRVFRTMDYGISDSLEPIGAVAVLRMGNIAEGRIKVNELKYVDAVDLALLLSPGDLLYNRTNSLDQIAKVGLYEGSVDVPVSFASYLVRLRTHDEVLPEYMRYSLNTSGMLGIARASAFVAIGQCNLNPSRYGEIPVAIPPRNEQKAIVEFLEKKTRSIDRLIAEADSAIFLLSERRTALISAAVTGKIDVRGLAMAEAA